MIMVSAASTKIPATIPTAAPRSSVLTFSVTSVLASSISSRTRIEACSVMSKTSSPTDFSSWGPSGSAPSGGCWAAASGVPGGGAGGAAAGEEFSGGHSPGGSSSNTRT